MNANYIIKALLKEGQGYLMGKRYCVSDNILYLIKDKEGSEVTCLNDIDKVIITDRCIELWRIIDEDSCECLRLTVPTIKEINEKLYQMIVDAGIVDKYEKDKIKPMKQILEEIREMRRELEELNMELDERAVNR